MSETDTWPEPLYSVGPAKHLHAIGVVSTCFNAFEETMFHLFAFHLARIGLPDGLIKLTYFQYDDARRLKAIKAVFDENEKEPKVIDRVAELIEYFDWASDARNKLLHAQPYPSPFSKMSGRLHLAKRASKRDPTLLYISPDLTALRDVADKINWGKITCAGVVIYLRYGRGTVSLPTLGHHPLPEKLVRPSILELEPYPYNAPTPTPLPPSSDGLR